MVITLNGAAKADHALGRLMEIMEESARFPEHGSQTYNEIHSPLHSGARGGTD